MRGDTHVFPTTEQAGNESEPYETQPLEAVEVRTDRNINGCWACEHGRCVQQVVTHPAWNGAVVIHACQLS